MTRRWLILLTVAMSSLPIQKAALAAELAGTVDQSAGPRWQSAYMDLDPSHDFKKGDRLVIRVEGSAEWVRVRLLPSNGNPAQSTGIVGSKMRVPPGGRIEITLKDDRPRVKQISVHAGKEAWGESLNPGGGEIRILGIDVNP